VTSRLERLRDGARNALELVRFGRLGDPYGGDYEIVDEGPHHKLRRYPTVANDAPVALLVPPLMVTAEVYDIAPDTSAARSLAARGISPFVVDFGAPETAEGGMRRTLDDHVRAVSRCIDRARELAKRDVHLCGYSQGGMFAYQTAALRRGDGVASIVTFGSPVDLHRGLPAIRRDVAGAMVELARPALESVAERISRDLGGLPGALTSTAFKIVSGRKEIEQRIDFVRQLHDRSALVRREARRRFLGGEGFVAWPGPALRAFLDDFIVHNRMLSGGFVIDGRTVTLADIDKPILAFVGATDDIARPATVRAITTAAPNAEVHLVTLRAGHFGLVVGSHAMTETWPIVADWISWREGKGEPPRAIVDARAHEVDERAHSNEPDAPHETDLELLLDAAAKSARAAWTRLGDAASSASDALDAVRYQEPRLRRLASMNGDTLASAALELARRATETPDATFFLWRDRAFSYRDADARVTNVVRGLHACGVRPGDAVLVVMASRPSFLTMTTALSRLGAVAVIAPPDSPAAVLRDAATNAEVRHVASDPEHAARVRGFLSRDVLVLGGGGTTRALAAGLVDMEAIDPEAVEMPRDFSPNAARARDLAVVFLRPTDSAAGELRAAPVTNHRVMLSALGAAAACTIKPGDTVYCCIPLHHPTSLLASVGSALASGARLALAERFDPATFDVEVRRAGATLVFYAGDMLRPLVERGGSRPRGTLPVRLFAGSGMRADLVTRLADRFGVHAIEFYASTTHRAILANVDKRKPGALGRVLPGSDPVGVRRVDLATKTVLAELASSNELGVLAVKGDGGEWIATNDVVRRDDDGDYWFVDSLSGFVRGTSTRALEDSFYAELDAASAAAYAVGDEIWLAFVGDATKAQVRAHVASRSPRPDVVLRLDVIPMTEGFRPKKSDLPRCEDDARIVWSTRF
jgi:putative long chain acyl-CoA synthase